MAIDLDEDFIAKAKKRLKSYPLERLVIQQGDINEICAEDSSFDSVVNFAAIHHILDWQKALKEVYRVLRKKGQFIFLEVTSQWIHRFPNRLIFEHPMENRFSSLEFLRELESLGFSIGENWIEKGGGDFIFCVAEKK